MSKLSVSIGIPAYNEGKNIKDLILSLLDQRCSNFILKEIIIISDLSSDNTEAEVKSIKNSRIKLFRNKKRLGQALGQNKILKSFAGDVLVLINADVLPKNKFLLEELIAPFYSQKYLGIVGGKVTPVKSESFLENIINVSVLMKTELYKKINHGRNIYLCHGRIRALSRNFAKSFKWKGVLSEDSFSYISCVQKGFTFLYEPKAEVLYRSPQSLNDHLKQSARFFQGKRELEAIFGKDKVNSYFHISKNLILENLAIYFFKYPNYFLSYICILIFSRFFLIKGKKYHARWEASESSKKVKI